jgi:hypothetical protein
MIGRRMTRLYQGAAIAERRAATRYDTYHIPDEAGGPLCGAETAPGAERRQIMLNTTLGRVCARCAQRWTRQQGTDVRDWWQEGR